jgi:hypothetical protein
MIMTHIRYTVKAEYAAQNKAHINQVMEELRALGRTDITYSVFVEDDGKTFNHWPFFASVEAKRVFEQLPSFHAFQAAFAESHPEVPPTVTNLTVVGSTSDLF